MIVNSDNEGGTIWYDSAFLLSACRIKLNLMLSHGIYFLFVTLGKFLY